MFNDAQIAAIRDQFPALTRVQNGHDVMYFDGPAGSQVPVRVANAVRHYLLHRNANSGGVFQSSLENDADFEVAQQVLGAFLGAADPTALIFGQSMTALAFTLSRALGATWQPGDEILVSSLDHDANVSPWVQAATAAGATVRRIALRPEDWTLDMDDLKSKLNERTRLVAVGVASNATGTINPVKAIADAAHAVGAMVVADAVHYAPHGLLDVEALGCDFLLCSAYKFFGPHGSVLWGRREHLDALPVQKVRPAYDTSPDRWMQGTPNYECIAGAVEAVRYIASLASDDTGSLRDAVCDAFGRIQQYEQSLTRQFLEGLSKLPQLKVHGITDETQLDRRVPTFSLTHSSLSPRQMSQVLADQGIYTWSGNHYALPFTEAAGLEPEGTLRIGFLHYNTRAEVERLLKVLAGFS